MHVSLKFESEEKRVTQTATMSLSSTTAYTGAVKTAEAAYTLALGISMASGIHFPGCSVSSTAVNARRDITVTFTAIDNLWHKA